MTRSEHGIISLPPVTASKLERAYTIHRSNAMVARACFNADLARYHAAKARALVSEFAKYPPFSQLAARRYIDSRSVQVGAGGYPFITAPAALAR